MKPEKRIMVTGHERSGNHFLINTLMNCMGFKTLYSLITDNPLKEALNYDCDIIKTHHQKECFDIGKLRQHFFIIYISREPKDIITSLYHYLKKNPHIAGKINSVNDILTMSMSRYTTDSEYHYSKTLSPNFVSRIIKHSAWANVCDCCVRYENLNLRFEETVKNIAKTLGETDYVIKRPDMVKNVVCAWRGVCDNWKEFFSDDDIKIYNRQFKEYMDKFIKTKVNNY